MNMKIYNNNFNDMNINKKISNMMLNQYQKGVSIKNEELEQETGNDGPVTVSANPQIIRLSKNKGVVPRTSVPSNSYTVVRKQQSSPSSNTTAEDFMIQSQVLDNELDQIISMMKLNNKEEFYEAPISRKIVNTDTGKVAMKAKSKVRTINNPSFSSKASPMKKSSKLSDNINEEDEGGGLYNGGTLLPDNFSADEKERLRQGINDRDRVVMADISRWIIKLEQQLKENINKPLQKTANATRQSNINALKKMEQKVIGIEKELLFEEQKRLIAEEKERVEEQKRLIAEEQKRLFAEEQERLIAEEQQKRLFAEQQERFNAEEQERFIAREKERLIEEENIRMHNLVSKNKNSYQTALELHNKGFDIERDRSGKLGEHGTFNDFSVGNAMNSYMGNNLDYKSKNGLRVIGNTSSANISPDLKLAIKKVTNLLTVTLLPLCRLLYKNRFQGISLQDKNTIPILYKELDDKMYILTSLNNTNNTQLSKLDNLFDSLFEMVKNGIASYVPLSGGSMVKFTAHPGLHGCLTDRPYLL